MQFSNDEKLTLFLIWWHCELEECISACEVDYSEDIVLDMLKRNYSLDAFIAEAYEVGESYTYFLSDISLSKLKDNYYFSTKKTDYFKHSIKITIEENND